MYLLYEFNTDESPALLSKALWQHHISHRIVHAEHTEQLWVLDPNQAPQALAILEQWQAHPDDLAISATQTDPRPVQKRRRTANDWYRSPMTIATLVIAALVALVTGLGEYYETLSWFTISEFAVVGNHIQFLPLDKVLAEGEYWRLLTPAFIHFGAAHLIFNALWIWEVGRKLEQQIGSLMWLVFALFVCIASNVAQYVINGYPLFGGLSGLVYGLVACAWLLPYCIRAWPPIISKPLMVFFVLWLVAGYTPIFSAIGLGNMANEAHLIGLVAGLVFAGLYSLGYKAFNKH